MDLIKQIRRHADEHYNDRACAWDWLAECWSDDEIRERIGRASTLAGAIRKLYPILSTYADRRADIQGA